MMRLQALSLAVLLAALPATAVAGDGCHPILVGPETPTGIAGCRLSGIGVASWYHGETAARNDCTWPWRDCQPIAVRSLRTGIVIRVTPAMFCDCYTGTPRQRLVDLTRDQVAALGLDPTDGLFDVEVWPIDADSGSPYLPDTSLAVGS